MNPNCDMKKFEISFNSRAEPIKKAYFGNKVSTKNPPQRGLNDAESRRRNELLNRQQQQHQVHYFRFRTGETLFYSSSNNSSNNSSSNNDRTNKSNKPLTVTNRYREPQLPNPNPPNKPPPPPMCPHTHPVWRNFSPRKDLILTICLIYSTISNPSDLNMNTKR